MSQPRARQARVPAEQDPRQQGSIILMTAMALFVLLGFVIIAISIGRMHVTRRELQSATDAAAVAAAFSMMEHGLPFKHQDVAPVFTSYYSRLGGPAFGVSNLERRAYDPAYPAQQNNIYNSQNRLLFTFQTSLQFDSQVGLSFLASLRFFNIRTATTIQVNENVWSRWPVLLFLLDRSSAMNDMMPAGAGGSSGRSAWQQLEFIVQTWTTRVLPVRSGLVLFAQSASPITIPPATDNTNRDLAILQAMTSNPPPAGGLQEQTNLQAAFDTARAMLNTPTMAGSKNVILISDGEATTSSGPQCVAQQDVNCHYDARQAACQLRQGAYSGLNACNVNGGYSGASNPLTRAPAVLAAEVQRVNHHPESTTTLRTAAGPDGGGPATGYYFLVNDVAGINAFFDEIMRAVCSFGPLRPQPGAGIDLVTERYHGTNPIGTLGAPPNDLNRFGITQPRRIYTLIRNTAGGSEHSLRFLTDLSGRQDWSGFTYGIIDNEVYVTLTLASCSELATLGNNGELVVRWGTPQILER